MKKKYVYDQDGTFYPITHTQAVMTPDGRTLEEKMQSSSNDVEGKLTGGGGANVYPFKHLGTFANVSLANNALDAAFVSSDAALQGHLRLIVNGQIMWCDQYALNYSLGHWLQVVFGVFKPSNDGSQLIYDYSKYHVAYRYRDGNNTPSWKDYSVDGLDLDTIVNLVVEALGGSGGGAPAVVDSSLDPTSTHAIQNKVVYDVLYNESTGLATQISAIQTSLTAGKIVMADGWGVLPSNPEEGMVAFVGGKIKTYTSGAWSDADPDETALYVAKASNVLYRWNGDVMESMVGQEVDDEWKYNSTKAVQSKKIQSRFRTLELDIYGVDKGTGETAGTSGMMGDMDGLKDVVLGQESGGVREGGLSDAVEGLSLDMYGGGTSEAPASGSVKARVQDLNDTVGGENGLSARVTGLEQSAITGIKVNGSAVMRDEQGMAEITVSQTGGGSSTYVASAVEGVTAEAGVFASGAVEVEEVSGADVTVEADAWDGDGSPSLVLSRKHGKILLCDGEHYYSRWGESGAIPSSSDLSDGATLIKHTTDGVPQISTYNGAAVSNISAGLCVDTSTKMLLLRHGSKYWKEWPAFGAMPSNGGLDNDETFIQYTLDGKVYLATYGSSSYKTTTLIYGDRSILQARAKSGMAGEATSQEPLSSVDWTEGEDDAILAVDTSTSELWLGYGSGGSYTYYPSWVACGPMPSSDEIAANNMLIQYSSGGKPYLASYDATTRRVTPSGSSAEAIAQIDDTSSPVQSAVLKERFETLEDRATLLENAIGSGGGNKSFTLLSDGDAAFRHFDYSKGNPGCFTPKVAPEDITVEDVDSIYAVKPPYEYTGEVTAARSAYLTELSGVKVLVGPGSADEVEAWENLFGPLATTPHLWTDYELTRCSELVDSASSSIKSKTDTGGTTEATAKANAAVMKGVFAKVAAGTVADGIGYGSCIGLYLKERYYVIPTRTSGGTAYDYPGSVGKASSYKTLCVNLPKDFIMVGVDTEEGETVTTGGFDTKKSLFYTDKSLYMYNFHLHKTATYKYFVVFMSTSTNISPAEKTDAEDEGDGVDQLQLIGCKFTSAALSASHDVCSEAHYGRGYYFKVSTPNIRPFKFYDGGESRVEQGYDYNSPKREVCFNSQLNHIYVKGCTFDGSKCICGSDLRVMKSWRVIENTFEDFSVVPLSFDCTNNSSSDMSAEGKYRDKWKDIMLYYLQTNTYMSCPLYIMGNTFSGKNEIFKYKEKKSGSYVNENPYACAVLAECREIYMLYNTIGDIYTGVRGDGAYCETYDAYMNCTQINYMHNTIGNVVRFMNWQGESVGIMKYKSTGIGYVKIDIEYSPGVRRFRNVTPLNTTLSVPIRRNVKYNKYRFDRERALDLWNALIGTYGDYTQATFPSGGLAISETGNWLSWDEYDNDKNTMTGDALDGVLGYHINNGVKTSTTIWDEVAIEDNEFDAGDGNINGFDGGQWIQCERFLLNRNVFKAKNYSSSEWWSHASDSSAGAEYMFRVRLLRKRGRTLVSIAGNTFFFASGGSTKSIRLFTNEYGVANTDVVQLTYEKVFWSNLSTAEDDDDKFKIYRLSEEGFTSETQGDGHDIHDNVFMTTGKSMLLTTCNCRSGRVHSDWIGGEAGGGGISDEDLQRIADLETENETLKSLLYGTSAPSGTPTVKPGNPAAGDGYIETRDGKRYYHKCKAAGSLAKIVFMIRTANHLGGKTVYLKDIQMPFSADEPNGVLTTDGSGDTAITLDTMETAVQTLRSALTLRGYTEESGIGSAGTFDFLEQDATHLWVRIRPKYAASSWQHLRGLIADASTEELRKIVYSSTGSSGFPTGTGTYNYSSVEGSAPEWYEAVEIQDGLIARLEALENQS